MKLSLRAVLATLAIAIAMSGQQRLAPDKDPLVPRYQANKTTSLSSAAEKVTVQATTKSDAIWFETADVYCSAACDITVYINGTAATATTLAIQAVSTAAAIALPTAYSGSNVGTGTTLKTFSLAAGASQTLDLSAYYIPAGAGTAANLSIGTSSITGTARIQIQWRN